MSIERSSAGDEPTASSPEQQAEEPVADLSARPAAHRHRLGIRARLDEERWSLPTPEYTPEELARGAAAEAADVAAGLDGSDEVYTDESGMPLPEYEGLLPEWMIDNIRRWNRNKIAGGTDAAPGSDPPDPPDPPHPLEARYSDPEDVREAFMRGRSVPEVWRELAEDPPAPEPEPTTELVRRERDLDFELGSSDELPDEFDLDDENTSAYDKGLNELRKAETIDNLESVGKFNVDLVQQWMGRPKPTGAVTGGPSDHPVFREARGDDLRGGEILVAPVVLLMLGDAFGRWVRGRFAEWKRSRGDHDNGGN